MENFELSKIPDEQSIRQDLIRNKLEGVRETFFRGRSPDTIRSDKKSLELFATFIGASSFEDLCTKFFSQDPGDANMKALEFKNWLVEQKKSPSTVNRRLCALSSLSKALRFGGAITWTPEIHYVPVETYRDTSGPGTDRFSEVMASLAKDTSPMAIRDRTILILLHDAALRRGELVSVDLENYKPEDNCIWVKAKKRTARVKIDLAPEMKAAIEDWLVIRGSSPGPMFINFDNSQKGSSTRLSGRSIARITHKYGIGNPHGIRHMAVGELSEALNGNIVEVMKFARHKDPKVTMIYIDNLKKRDAEGSKILAEFRHGNRKPKSP